MRRVTLLKEIVSLKEALSTTSLQLETARIEREQERRHRRALERELAMQLRWRDVRGAAIAGSYIAIARAAWRLGRRLVP